MPEEIEVLSEEEARRVEQEEGKEQGVFDQSGFFENNDNVDDDSDEDDDLDISDIDPDELDSEEGDDDDEEEGEDSDEEEGEDSDEDFDEDDADEEEGDDDEDNEGFDVAELTEGVFADEDELVEFAQLLNEDEYLKGLIDYYRKTGDATPYLEANQYDYDKMSDEEIMRLQFEKEYKDLDLNKQEMDEFFERKVLSKYGLDGDPEDMDEVDLKFGKAELKKEASEIRKQLKEEQANFKAPAREEQSESPEQDKRERLRNQARIKSLVNKVAKNGQLSVKSGDSELNLSVNKDNLVEMISNTDNILERLKNEDGTVNFKSLAYLQNPDEFEAAIRNDENARAKEQLIAEIKNKRKKGGKGRSSEVTPDKEKNDPYSAYSIKNMKVVK